MTSKDENAPEVYHEAAGLEPLPAEKSTNVAHIYGHHPGYQTCKPPLRYPFGLGPLAFGGLVALVTAIVVGAAVGGGLGGTLASCRAQQSKSNSPNGTATSTSTTTSSNSTSQLISNYTVPAVDAVDSIYINCPQLNSQTYTTHWGGTFSITCGFDYTNGLNADGGGVIADLVGTIAYTLDDCFEACSSLNYQAQKWGWTQTCKGVTWLSDLKNVTASVGGNCWLKNATLAAGTNPNSCSECVSGVST